MPHPLPGGSSFSFKPISKPRHRHARRCVVMVIPNHIPLTMEIKPHKTLYSNKGSNVSDLYTGTCTSFLGIPKYRLKNKMKQNKTTNRNQTKPTKQTPGASRAGCHGWQTLWQQPLDKEDTLAQSNWQLARCQFRALQANGAGFGDL